MKPNPVGWFEIYVKDLARAQKFYEKVFETKLTPLVNEEELRMVSFPMDMTSTGAGGALAWMKGFPVDGNSVIIYFTSEDCKIEENRFVAAGGKLQKGKSSIGEYGFISLGVDTEGNIFGVHSMK